MSNFKTFKTGIALEPQSSDPSNPSEGMIQQSDGTVRAAGLWQYVGGTWQQAGGGAGSSDTLHLIKAASDLDTDFTIKSIDDLLPDFEATDTLTATFNVPTSGNDALLSDDDAHKVYKFATTTASQYDAVGRSFTIPKGYRGRDILCEFQYRTKDTSGDSVDADYMTWLYDETNGVKLTASANEAIGQTVLSVSQNPTALETDTFVDGDVSVANDTITLTAHTLKTGDLVQLTTTLTLPTGLSLATDYYVINIDANTIALATSYANALANTRVDITAAAGGGTHTISKRLPIGTKIWISCDSDVLETHVTAISSTTITVADALVSQWTIGKPAFTGILTDVLTTLNAADSDIAKKGTSFKKYVLVPETCESIAFVVQQLTSQTDSFLYFDNILLTADPFKKAQTIEKEIFASATNSSVTATSQTLLPLTTDDDPDGLVDETNDRIDIPRDGIYKIGIGGNVAFGTTNWAAMGYQVNTGAVVYKNILTPTSSSGSTCHVYFPVRLNKGDYVRFYTQSGSVSAITAINVSVQSERPENNISHIVESADSVMSDWVAFTPSWTATGGTPTIGNGVLEGERRRVGDSAEFKIRLTTGSTTTIGTTTSWRFSDPSFSIDSTKMTSAQVVGEAYINDTGTAFYIGTVVYDSGSNAVTIQSTSTGDRVGYNNPFLWTVANADYLSIQFTVPIAGWSATNKPLLAVPTVTVGQDAEQVIGTTNFSSPSTNTISNLGSYSAGTFTATARCKVFATVDGTSPTIDAVSQRAKGTILNPSDTLVLGGTPTGYSIVVEPEIGQQNMAAIISQPTVTIYGSGGNAPWATLGGSTSWKKQTLVTEIGGDIAEVGAIMDGSGGITLPAGKYHLTGTAGAYNANGFTFVKIYNETDLTDIKDLGQTAYNGVAATTAAIVTSAGFNWTFTLTKSTKIAIYTKSTSLAGTEYLGYVSITRKK